MDQSCLHERITDQFSYRCERADISRTLDRLLDTDEFLNLGYSEWYQLDVAGSSRCRLVTEVGSTIVSHLPATDGVVLLDGVCGRGGPAIHLADRFGFDVTGLDLVPYNVERATESAREERVEAEFVVGDAMQLPFSNGSFAACTAIDALVYLSDRDRVFPAIAAVIDPSALTEQVIAAHEALPFLQHVVLVAKR